MNDVRNAQRGTATEFITYLSSNFHVKMKGRNEMIGATPGFRCYFLTKGFLSFLNDQHVLGGTLSHLRARAGLDDSFPCVSGSGSESRF